MHYARSNEKISTMKSEEFKKKILESLSKDVLTMAKVGLYERRTRDYCRLYTFIDKQVESNEIKREDVDYSMLEKQRKIYRSHRNIKEIERKFLDDN